MFKLEVGKKYVCRNGEVRELLHTASPHCGGIRYKNDASLWWFGLNSPEYSHTLFFNRESEWDIVAEYVEKKPRKASSPYKKLLTAKDGDVFVLKGERFTVNTMKGYHWINGEICLTSKDRQNDKGYLPIHVRNEKNYAVFKRQELIDLLRSGKYKVD